MAQFEGSEPSLKGYVYDFTGERNPDQYIKTTKQVKLYAGRTYNKFPCMFTKAIEELFLEDPEAPECPENAGDVFAMEWKADLKEYRTKMSKYTAFWAGLYNVLVSQCMEVLMYKLKSHPSFEEANQDGIALLKIIKVILYSFEQMRYQEDELMKWKSSYLMMRPHIRL